MSPKLSGLAGLWGPNTDDHLRRAEPGNVSGTPQDPRPTHLIRLILERFLHKSGATQALSAMVVTWSAHPRKEWYAAAGQARATAATYSGSLPGVALSLAHGPAPLSAEWTWRFSAARMPFAHRARRSSGPHRFGNLPEPVPGAR